MLLWFIFIQSQINNDSILIIIQNIYTFSLGVETVDKDVMKQPPRKPKDSIINRHLIINVLISASIIVCGTLWVFHREVSVNLNTCIQIHIN